MTPKTDVWCRHLPRLITKPSAHPLLIAGLSSQTIQRYHLPCSLSPCRSLPPSLPPSLPSSHALSLRRLIHCPSSAPSRITSPSTRSTDSFLYTPALSGCSAGVVWDISTLWRGWGGETAQGLLPSAYQGKRLGSYWQDPCWVSEWRAGHLRVQDSGTAGVRRSAWASCKHCFSHLYSYWCNRCECKRKSTEVRKVGSLTARPVT